MATYTPNYNLSKPESTDDYRDFLNSYGDNMDKIDNNMGGGGGGGGHTIVDPTGTDMPQENKLQFTGNVSVSDDAVNGQTVVDVEGGGNYYLNTLYSTEEKKVGYWTDNKPLYQRTVHISALPSSATSQQYAHNIPDIDKICYYQSISRASSGSTVILNRVAMNGSSLNGSTSYDVFVNKTYITISVGQDRSAIEADVTIQYTKTTDTADPNPQTGGVIYLPSIYSEEEREIGVWRDGKPLYQRILTLTQNTALVADTWVKTEFNKDTMETLVRVDATIGASGAVVEALSGGFIDGKLALNSARNVGLNASDNARIIVQYTKTTDTAGSGSWTPSGAKAVHYSFTEHIVGTWFGETLWEKTIAYVSSAGQADTDKVIDTSIRHGTNCYVVDLQGIQTYGYLRNNGTSPTPNATSDPEPLSQGTLYLPYYGGSSMNSAHIYLYSDGIHFKKRGGSANANSIILTVRYVKI